MKTYRLRIKPQGSFLTPWQADTIFGSLCWVMVWKEGEDALKRFLHEYRNGNPAFVLSNGFPGDFLPAPAHISLTAQKGASLDDYQKSKKLKKVSWLAPALFESVRQGNVDLGDIEEPETFKTFTTLHSSINRITGTTGHEGSLFELEEYAVQADDVTDNTVTIYLKIRDEWKDQAFSLFKDLSTVGYGKKRSTGKGNFKVVGKLEPFDAFDDFSGANGFVSLSDFVLAKDDPTKGFYKTMVKYGKLGGEYAFSESPFKKPLLMIRAGSTFYEQDGIKPFYGRMVEGISITKPEVVHYGYSFPVPIRLEEINV